MIQLHLLTYQNLRNLKLIFYKKDDYVHEIYFKNPCIKKRNIDKIS